jgi:predicted lipoprotein with Yx(FWY)xxD motif
MRKSGWAAAAGLGSVVLLLTACGGSSGPSSTSSSTSTTTAQATATANGQPSSTVGLPAKGSVVLVVQKSAIGYVLAEASGQVVYVYDKDTKGGTPTCTGSCAAIWPPLTGNPVASPAATGLGTLGTVSDANGAKQVTYNGKPLYIFKGAKPLSVKGNGVGGVWHVIKLSKSNVTGG